MFSSIKNILPDLAAIKLILIQGITEALPISSSMHLNLLTTFNHDLAAFMHISAMLAFMLIMQKFIKYRIIGIFKQSTSNLKLIFKILLMVMPTIFIGYFIRNYNFNNIQNNAPYYNILAAIFLILSDFTRQKRSLISLQLFKCLIIGLLISCAFIPGISRMGITYTILRLFQIRKFDALALTILIGIPITAGAAIIAIKKINMAIINLQTLIMILITSAITYLALTLVFKILKNSRFFGLYFGIYRILFSLCILI